MKQTNKNFANHIIKLLKENNLEVNLEDISIVLSINDRIIKQLKLYNKDIKKSTLVENSTTNENLYLALRIIKSSSSIPEENKPESKKA